jgi:hypothetical protein
MNKLNIIKKRKRIISDKISSLQKKQQKLNHEEKVLEKNLVQTYNANILSFTKKDLINALSCLNLPVVLNYLISDYGYQTKYIKHSCYESSHSNEKYYYHYDSIAFSDYLVEYTKRTLYISNIFTGEMIDIIVDMDYDQTYGLTRFKRIFGDLYIHNNKNVHRIIFEKDNCSIVKQDEEKSKKIIKACEGYGNCEKIFNKEQVECELYSLLGKRVSLHTEIFNVDENNYLSVEACIDYKINAYNEQYILEYDLTKKCIIEMYKLDTDHIFDMSNGYGSGDFNKNHYDITIQHSCSKEYKCYVYVKSVV